MKRLSALVCIVSLCAALFAGCNVPNSYGDFSDTQIRSKVISELTEFEQIAKDAGSIKSISKYIESLAKEKGFKVIRDKANNIIIEKGPTVGYENAPLTIIHSNIAFRPEWSAGNQQSFTIIDTNDLLTLKGTQFDSSSSLGIATAFFVLENSQQHGPIRVIFTAKQDDNRDGIDQLDTKHLQGDYLINLNLKKDGVIGGGSLGATFYEMSRKITWSKPNNAEALHIRLEGLPNETVSYTDNPGAPNAIKIVNELLAKAKSSEINFELAAFNGGTLGCDYPNQAEAVIVIDSSDKSKFNRLFKSYLESVKNQYSIIRQDNSLTVSATAMPNKVVSDDDCSRIISFIYGIVNGLRVEDVTNGDNITKNERGCSNIGTVSLASGSLKCEVYTISSSPEMDSLFLADHESICSFSEISFRVVKKDPASPFSKKSELITGISGAYRQLYEDNPKVEPINEVNEMGKFYEKNTSLDIISIGPHIKEDGSKNDILYLDSVSKPASLLIEFLCDTNKTMVQ